MSNYKPKEDDAVWDVYERLVELGVPVNDPVIGKILSSARSGCLIVVIDEGQEELSIFVRPSSGHHK